MNGYVPDIPEGYCDFSFCRLSAARPPQVSWPVLPCGPVMMYCAAPVKRQDVVTVD